MTHVQALSAEYICGVRDHAHQCRLCSSSAGAELQVPLPLSLRLRQGLPVHRTFQMRLVLRISSKVGLQQESTSWPLGMMVCNLRPYKT